MSDGSSRYAVHVDVPAVAGLSACIVAWGRELDARPITTARELTDASEGASPTGRRADSPQTCQNSVVDYGRNTPEANR